ncbi:MAG TPA: hypothetical protein VGF84_14540, partial [Micromonosporaceae bacterium]
FGAAQAAQVWLRGANILFAPFWVEQQARIRERLEDRVFDDVYAQGAALTLDQAVAVALSVDHPDLLDGSKRFADIDATERYLDETVRLADESETVRLADGDDATVEIHKRTKIAS